MLFRRFEFDGYAATRAFLDALEKLSVAREGESCLRRDSQFDCLGLCQ